MKKIAVFAANLVLVLLVLAVLPAVVDVSKLFQYFGQADAMLVLAAAVIYLAGHFMGAVRLGWLFEKMGSRLGNAEVFLAYMASLLLSDLTPGRIGYSYIVLRLRKNKVPAPLTAKAMGVALASDFSARAAAVLFFAVAVAGALSQQLFWVAGGVAAIAFLMLFAATKEIRLVTNLLSRVPVVGKRLAETYSSVFSYHIGKRLFAASVVASVVGTFVRGISWLLIAKALFPATGFGALEIWNMTILAGVVTGVSFIPVSLSGFGVVEGVGALFLKLLFGLSLTQAAAVMFLIRAEEFAADLVVGGLGLKGDFQQAAESVLK